MGWLFWFLSGGVFFSFFFMLFWGLRILAMTDWERFVKCRQCGEYYRNPLADPFIAKKDVREKPCRRCGADMHDAKIVIARYTSRWKIEER